MTCCGPKLPAPSVFSYQAILSSLVGRRAGRPGPRRRPGPPRRPSGHRPLPWRSPAGCRSSPPVGVLVPGDLVVVRGGGQHVQIAVPVQVRREDGVRRVRRRGDHLLRCRSCPRRRCSRTRRSCRRRTRRRGRPDPRPRPRPPRRPSRARPPPWRSPAGPRSSPAAVRVLVPGDLVVAITEAERTSRSPSPSRSAAKTDRAASAAVEMTCWVPKLARAVRVLVPGDHVRRSATRRARPGPRHRLRPLRRPSRPRRPPRRSWSAWGTWRCGITRSFAHYPLWKHWCRITMLSVW